MPPLRTRALESLLVEKGLLTTDIIDGVVQKYEQDVGPLNGAKVVARAWIDPDYKCRLLEDGTAAYCRTGFWRRPRQQNRRAGKHTQCPPRRRFAPFAPVIPGPYSACRRIGTNPTPIALGWCGSRERSCENLTSSLPDSVENPRLGQQFGSPLHGATRTPCWHGRPYRRNNSLRSSRATR